MRRATPTVRGLEVSGRAAALLAALCVVATGCRKEHSSEYFSAKGRLDSLSAHLGDDAYLDPEIEAVVSELRAVRPSAVEYPEAVALLARVESERARRLAAAPRAPANEASRAAGAAAPSLGLQAEAGPPDGGSDGGADDARPAGGMSEEAFKEKFGACFGSPRALMVPGEPGKVIAYPLVLRSECRARHGSLPFSYIFAQGKLKGTITEAPPAAPDAGVALPAPPQQPTPPPAPAVPGATGVEGYDGTPRGQENPYDGTPRPPS